MTSEQIAELRKLESEATPAPWKPGYSYGADFRERADQNLGAAARNALPRLLDEREALLGAAKYLVENYPERQLTRYMISLKRAIAKAESP